MDIVGYLFYDKENIFFDTFREIKKSEDNSNDPYIIKKTFVAPNFGLYYDILQKKYFYKLIIYKFGIVRSKIYKELKNVFISNETEDSNIVEKNEFESLFSKQKLVKIATYYDINDFRYHMRIQIDSPQQPDYKPDNYDKMSYEQKTAMFIKTFFVNPLYSTLIETDFDDPRSIIKFNRRNLIKDIINEIGNLDIEAV